jgi:hypothetical protein
LTEGVSERTAHDRIRDRAFIDPIAAVRDRALDRRQLPLSRLVHECRLLFGLLRIMQLRPAANRVRPGCQPRSARLPTAVPADEAFQPTKLIF